jgi:sulfite dehydrogenase (quinone) subunit SoeC
MNPAFSVIFFTTASGAGYGMLVVLSVCAVMGQLPQHTWLALVTMVIALGLITAGLLSSTLHLGHPERAWRAFSQWRSSWLSREGIASLVAYIPALLFGLCWAFPNIVPLPIGVLGIATALAATATVYTTAMIYRSLKPIHAWHNVYVVPGYLVLGLMSGAVFTLAITSLFAQPLPWLTPICGVLFAAGLTVKWLYWSFIDSTPALSTPATAVGLSGSHTRVASIEWPHTEQNYVLKEMGYQVARKHSPRLRYIAIWSGFLFPAVMIEASLVLPSFIQPALATGAAVLMAAGLIAERWLFFAEAKHTVTLYYGAQSA